MTQSPEQLLDAGQYIRYANTHVGPILAGEKYATARYDFDRDYSEGDEVVLVDEDDEVIGVVEITGIETMTLRNLSSRDIDGHRTYDSLGECVSAFAEYYPTANLSPQTEVTVIWHTTPETAR